MSYPSVVQRFPGAYPGSCPAIFSYSRLNAAAAPTRRVVWPSARRPSTMGCLPSRRPHAAPIQPMRQPLSSRPGLAWAGLGLHHALCRTPLCDAVFLDRAACQPPRQPKASKPVRQSTGVPLGPPANQRPGLLLGSRQRAAATPQPHSPTAGPADRANARSLVTRIMASRSLG